MTRQESSLLGRNKSASFGTSSGRRSLNSRFSREPGYLRERGPLCGGVYGKLAPLTTYSDEDNDVSETRSGDSDIEDSKPTVPIAETNASIMI